MKTIKEMKEELVHYYEAAGFTGIEEKELKAKTDEEIRILYNQSIYDAYE